MTAQEEYDKTVVQYQDAEKGTGLCLNHLTSWRDVLADFIESANIEAHVAQIRQNKGE